MRVWASTANARRFVEVSGEYPQYFNIPAAYMRKHGHCFGDEWWISKEDEGDDNENRLLPSLAREEDELSSVSDSVDEKLAVLIYSFSRLRIVNEAVENHKGAVADGGLANSNETAKAAGNFQPTIRLKVSPDEFLEQLRALTAVGSISVDFKISDCDRSFPSVKGGRLHAARLHRKNDFEFLAAGAKMNGRYLLDFSFLYF
uniref:Uncharacterized protein n=1 Tax=Onchocerca volvulus TaxID=6282 RepID=A0A8R1XVG4_ONCVO